MCKTGTVSKCEAQDTPSWTINLIGADKSVTAWLRHGLYMGTCRVIHGLSSEEHAKETEMVLLC